MLDLLESCQICPRRCKVNRLKGQRGFCRAGRDVVIYNSHLHMGEEPPLSGNKGSGTIFFSNCNSRCVYCQNYKFSQSETGKKMDENQTAGLMLELQKKGAHNINLVTPTHYIPQIIDAVIIAKGNGLNIPIIYNTNGYELTETLDMLKDIVDIFLPDMRYSNDNYAVKYSNMPGYVHYNRTAVKKMYELAGDLQVKNDIAVKGLIIRHLVLPNDIAGTAETMKFIRNEISVNMHISLMCQYFPVYKANEYPEINRQITLKEYDYAVEILAELGLANGWCQEWQSVSDRDTFLGEGFKMNI